MTGASDFLHQEDHRQKWGITGRLIGWFMAISMLPIIALLLLNQKLTEDTICDTELAHLDQMADFKVRQISGLLDNAQQTLATQLQVPLVGQSMVAFDAAMADSDAAALQRTDQSFRPYLNILLRQSGYQDFMLFDQKGVLVFAQGNRFAPGIRLDGDDLRDSRLTRAAQETLTTFQTRTTGLDFALGETDAPLFITAPVITDGVLRGVGVAKLSPLTLAQIVGDPTGLGRSGTTILGQEWHGQIRLVSPPRNMDVPINHAFLPMKGPQQLPLRMAINGDSGFDRTHDHRGTPMLAAWRNIPEAGWGLVVRRNEAEVLELVDRQRTLLLSVALLTLTVVTLLALYASRSLTRPIRALTQAVRRMGGGNLQESVSIQSDDEIGELASAFNGMTAELRNVYRTIEDEVYRRTLQLENSNHALEQTRDELRKFFQVVEYGPVAVVITNGEGVVEYVNPRFREITGYGFDDVVGNRPPVELLPPDETIRQNIWNDIRQGREWRGEYPTKRRNGCEFWLATSISPVRLGDGRISHFVAIMEDITSRKVTEDQLLTAKDVAVAANRAKSEFLAVMSHEIRTPMNGILGMTQLMLDTPLSALQRDYLDTIHSSSEALLSLLNDILDFSKLEAGRVDLELMNFSVAETIGSVIDLLSTKAAEKKLRLVTLLPSDLPPLQYGDPSRLRQILLNLIGNAIKFTDKGQITVAVDAAPPVSEGRRKHSFSVTDTGIGISPDVRQRLFQSFTQGDTSISRRYGGSGLGLAICRRLVEVQGGEIGVESEPGQGSRFFFHLSYGPAEKTGTREIPPAKISGALPRLAILLAEDNGVNRKVAAALLQKWGHLVTAVADGREAVEAVEAAQFDVVLMDVQMPGMDGLEATRRIRALSGPAGHLPIIALTANAMPVDQQRCLDAGMDDYVSKPIEHTRLFAALERVYVKRMEGLLDKSLN